ncbi:MAG: LUD domain-containing protein [Bacteroides sp.]|nr:LUD domain-containing protein [Bacteroides sp.]
MSSREDILQSIRSNTQMRYEKPDYTSLEVEAVTYSNLVEHFSEMVDMVGGRAFLLGDLKIDDVVTRRYSPRRVASTMTEVEVGGVMQKLNCVTFNPDEVASTAELDGTDVAIVKGCIGVCENGAVWIQQDLEQRAIYFMAEALVILLDHRDLVNNMHEAYKRIDTGEYGYGVFISGPSKTADIEQALVLGAHGACDVMVLII